MLSAQKFLLPLITPECSEIVSMGIILIKTSKRGYTLIEHTPVHEGTSWI